MQLPDIYLRTLALCTPETLVRRALPPDHPRNIVAIGKCAGSLLDGIDDYDEAFVAIPEGYRLPMECGDRSRRFRTHERELRLARGKRRLRSPHSIAVHVGGHPQVTPASFDTGRALLAFIDAHDDITFLISGGGSACVEVAADGVSERAIIETNARLIASGLPIGEINAVRKRMSAIKGGKLRARGRQVVMIYSDVATGRLSDVASGPVDTADAILIADNTTLVNTAAQVIEGKARRIREQIEGDVEEAAQRLAREARTLKSGETLVAGGEPTAAIKGNGRGGRDVELAVRFALAMQGETGFRALFASSDGVDGNSGVAGIHLPRIPAIANVDEIAAALGRSDSLPIATQLGEPIMIAPTGNNLRDLFLVARD